MKMAGVFLGGLPTRLEVDELMHRVPIEVGTRVSHADVAEIIGVPPKTNRFRTVTGKWRERIEKDHRIRISSEGGVFTMLTADESCDAAQNDFKKVGRATRRLVIRTDAIDTTQLTGERVQRHNLLKREGHAILEAVRKSAKEISAPKPVVSNRALAKS